MRAAVFAGLCVTLTVAGHGLSAGGMPPAWADGAGFLAVLALGCVLGGRERSLSGITAAMLPYQPARIWPSTPHRTTRPWRRCPCRWNIAALTGSPPVSSPPTSRRPSSRPGGCAAAKPPSGPCCVAEPPLRCPAYPKGAADGTLTFRVPNGLGIAGLEFGLLGLIAAGLAISRSRTTGK